MGWDGCGGGIEGGVRRVGETMMMMEGCLKIWRRRGNIDIGQIWDENDQRCIGWVGTFLCRRNTTVIRYCKLQCQ